MAGASFQHDVHKEKIIHHPTTYDISYPGKLSLGAKLFCELTNGSCVIPI